MIYKSLIRVNPGKTNFHLQIFIYKQLDVFYLSFILQRKFLFSASKWLKELLSGNLPNLTISDRRMLSLMQLLLLFWLNHVEWIIQV